MCCSKSVLWSHERERGCVAKSAGTVEATRSEPAHEKRGGTVQRKGKRAFAAARLRVWSVDAVLSRATKVANRGVGPGEKGMSCGRVSPVDAFADAPHAKEVLQGGSPRHGESSRGWRETMRPLPTWLTTVRFPRCTVTKIRGYRELLCPVALYILVRRNKPKVLRSENPFFVLLICCGIVRWDT